MTKEDIAYANFLLELHKWLGSWKEKQIPDAVRVSIDELQMYWQLKANTIINKIPDDINQNINLYSLLKDYKRDYAPNNEIGMTFIKDILFLIGREII